MIPKDRTQSYIVSHHHLWELFSHDADIGLRGYGDTLNEALENIALALTAVMTDPSQVRCSQRICITSSLTRTEDPFIVYDWLNAVIFAIATENMIFGRYHLQNQQDIMIGWGWGEHINEARHHPAVEIKGATMTCLDLKKISDSSFVAECVVDV